MASPGEEALCRAGRVGAPQRGLQHPGQIFVRRLAQIVRRPLRDRIGRRAPRRIQFFSAHPGELIVQVAHDQQVIRQRAQFGRGSQLELRPLVHAERLIVAVSLHPQQVHAVTPFVQGETVDDRTGALRGEQPLPDQPVFRRLARVVELLKHPRDSFLRRPVQRGVDLQIQPVHRIVAIQAQE
jgi:hypothetical protein